MDEPEPRPAPRPTPVRDAMEGTRPDQQAPSPVPQERRIEVDGRLLIVRLQGSGMAGPAPGRTPLLLLGFFLGEGGEGPARESVVAAPSLDAVDEAALVRAWEAGVDPKGTGVRADIFADSVGDRRRGR